MKSQNSLMNGFYKTLFSLAVPIILQNLIQTFVNILDTIMVGQLGSVEIAAVGLGNQIFFILNMILFGIGSGGAIFISQFWGSNNLKGIKNATGLILSCSVIAAVVFMAAGVVFPEFLIGLYTEDTAVISAGAKYLRVVALSYPVTAVSFAYQMSFRSTEHVCLPMVGTAVSLVMNIIFNTIFIFGLNVNYGFISISIPALGVVGAATATLVARLCEFFVVMIYSYTHHFESCAGIRELLDFDMKFAAKVFKTALPVIISETCWGLGISMQNSIFAHAGTDAIAAFNITNTISQLTWVFFIGMGNAAAVILGKKIGAGEEVAARAYVRRFSWLMPLSGAVLAVLLIPLSLCLPFMFNVESHIIGIARQMIYVLMCGYPMRAYNMLLIVGICRSGGDTVFAMINDNVWMWCVTIPLASLFAFVLGLPAWCIMLCFEFEQMFKCIVGIFRVHSGKWLHRLA